MPIITVIIPVYNAQNYLERCVKSFLNQSFKDFELLLIDDGSSDNSGFLCDAYSDIDSRVIVCHQDNKGVGFARQAGLDIAKGEYVIFADSDDWVEEKMLKELHEKAAKESADIVICDYFVDGSPTASKVVSQKPSVNNPMLLMREMLKGELHGSTWNKLYKLQTIKNNLVRFPEGINYCEDLWFNCDLLKSGDLKIAYLDKAYYHYDHYSNVNGLSRVISRKALINYLSFIEYIFDYLDKTTDAELITLLKLNSKILAFRSDCDSREFYSVFPESSRAFRTIIRKSDNAWIHRTSLLLSLNGQLFAGRVLLKCYSLFYLPVAKCAGKLLKR